MTFTSSQNFWLAAILIFLTAACIRAVVKSDSSNQGRFVWALVISCSLIQLAFDKSNYSLLMQEDGPAEWATFYAFLFAGISFTVRAWQQRASSGRLQFLSLILLGCFCFFVAGEEISWAQRLLGFKPPDIFLKHNFQLEANIHNIFKGKTLAGYSLDSKYLVALVAGLFGILLPLFGCIFPRAVKPVSAIVPDLRFAGFFALVVWVELSYPINFTGEAAELYLGCLFFLSQKTLPRRKNHFIVAAIFFLGILTPMAVDRILYGASEANTALSRKELKQLGKDLSQPGVLKKKLFKKGIVHKRILTAEKTGYFSPSSENRFLNGRPSALGVQGRKDRFGYYLDPWNDPYWIYWRKNPPRLILYSFGPNRRRDLILGKKIKNNGDDVSIVLKVTKRQPKQP